jgi:hypothetical protein
MDALKYDSVYRIGPQKKIKKISKNMGLYTSSLFLLSKTKVEKSSKRNRTLAVS